MTTRERGIVERVVTFVVRAVVVLLLLWSALTLNSAFSERRQRGPDPAGAGVTGWYDTGAGDPTGVDAVDPSR